MIGWLWTYFFSKVRNLEWAPCIMELRREVSLSLYLLKARHCSNSNIGLFYIFPCIFQLIISPLFWTILGHFISFLAIFRPFHFVWAIFRPFHFVWAVFRPFHFVWAIFRPFHFGHPVRQGRGWSIYQFRYPSTLNKNQILWGGFQRVTIVDINECSFYHHYCWVYRVE